MTRRWQKYSLLALITVLVLLLLIPLLIPTEQYIKQTQQQLSLAVNRQVTVGFLRFSLLPRIKLVIGDIRIKGDQDEGDLTVARAYLYPGLFSLFTGSPVIEDMRLHKVTASWPLLQALSTLPATGDTTGASVIKPEDIIITELHVKDGNIRLGPYQLAVVFSEEGIDQLELEQDEGGEFYLSLDKMEAGYEVHASISDWQPPMPGMPVLTSLRADGILRDTSVQLEELSVHVLGGTAEGKGGLDWAKQWQLQGQLALSNIDIAQVLSLLEEDVVADGILQGTARFNAKADKVDQLLPSLTVDGQVSISKSVVHTVGKGLFMANARSGFRLQPAGLELIDAVGELYGGTASASRVQLDWSDGWRLHGDMALSQVEIESLLAVLDIDQLISGKLDGTASFMSTSAAKLSEASPVPVIEDSSTGDVTLSRLNSSQSGLLQSMTADGHFKITKPVVHTAGKGMHMNSVQSSFNLQSSSLVLKDVESALYSGRANARQVQLQWADGWRLQGDLTLAAVDVESFLSVFDNDRIISGRFGGTFNYSSQAPTAEKLFEAPENSGDFRLVDGVIYDVDLVAAAKGAGKEAMRGKNTRYKELKGHLEMKNWQRELTNLSISSDLLEAGGNISISPDDKLTGRINVSLRKTLSVAGVDLKISGTLQEPNASLPATTKAGAAIGTVLGGPGVGTAVGAKVGESVEKVGDFISNIFGADKKKEDSASNTTPAAPGQAPSSQ